YAEGTDWYRANQPFEWSGHRYHKKYPPRFITPDELVHVGQFRGVPVFASRGDSGTPISILALPVRPGCVFQLYEVSAGL
ncbi:MAG TPA: hypothetical protein VF541_09580, partial [Longimicrobium sp.]